MARGFTDWRHPAIRITALRIWLASRKPRRGYVTLDESWRDISPVCQHCRYLHFPDGDRLCDAFLAGIPKAIWNGENDHTKPYPGDHGIQFVALTSEEVEAQRLEAAERMATRDQELTERLARIKAERRKAEAENANNPG